jgi:calcineurin-like phosphoesterase family protein
METWFTSDHHFGHANIIRFCNRPFWNELWLHPAEPDVEKMNEALIQYWNETVAPDDVVYHVGDFAMGPRDTVGKVAPRLNGEIHLILGNHDRPYRGKKEGQRYDQMYLDAGFATIQSELMYEGYRVNHFPYDVDFRRNGEDKFSSMRPTRDGIPLIHGHVHDTWDEVVNGDQINVSIDMWDYRPVNFETIREMLPL